MMDEGRIIRGNWESKVHYEYAQYTAMIFKFSLIFIFDTFQEFKPKVQTVVLIIKMAKYFTFFKAFLNSYLIAQ